MEKNLEKKIVAYCKKRGLVTSKFTDQSRRGAPDRIVWFKNGVLLFIETKYGNNGPSEHQSDYQKFLHEHRHHSIVSKDFEWIKAHIDTLHAAYL